MVKFGVLLIGMFGFASLAAGQSTFDGKWTAQVVRPAPNPSQNLTITLKSDAGKVSGSVVGADPLDSPIERSEERRVGKECRL